MSSLSQERGFFLWIGAMLGMIVGLLSGVFLEHMVASETRTRIKVVEGGEICAHCSHYIGDVYRAAAKRDQGVRWCPFCGKRFETTLAVGED